MDAHISVNEAEHYSLRDTGPAISYGRDAPFGYMNDFAATVASKLCSVIS